MVIVVDRSVVGQDTLGVRLDPLVVWWDTILENVDIYLELDHSEAHCLETDHHFCLCLQTALVFVLVKQRLPQVKSVGSLQEWIALEVRREGYCRGA